MELTVEQVQKLLQPSKKNRPIKPAPLAKYLADWKVRFNDKQAK
jgi:hypothetical protein